MSVYTIRHLGDSEMIPIESSSINLVKNKLKDHQDLDLFTWSANAELYFCRACLRGGVWHAGYGYGEKT